MSCANKKNGTKTRACYTKSALASYVVGNDGSLSHVDGRLPIATRYYYVLAERSAGIWSQLAGSVDRPTLQARTVGDASGRYAIISAASSSASDCAAALRSFVKGGQR
jgi:hypothetical protein